MWGRVQRHLSSGYATTLQVGVFKSGRVLRGGRKQFYFRFRKQKKTTLRHRNDFHGKVIEFWGLRHRVPSAFWLFLERSALIVVFMSFLLFLRPSPIKLWRNLFKKPIFSVGKRFENNNKKTVKLGKPASKCWMIIVFSLTKLRNCLMKL